RSAPRCGHNLGNPPLVRLNYKLPNGGNRALRGGFFFFPPPFHPFWLVSPRTLHPRQHFGFLLPPLRPLPSSNNDMPSPTSQAPAVLPPLRGHARSRGSSQDGLQQRGG